MWRRTLCLLLLLAPGAAAGLKEHLFAAIEAKEPKSVRRILELGADANSRNSSGLPALQVALYRGSTEVAQALVDAGADVNATDKGTGAAALHIAARRDNVEAIRLLLKHGADPKAKDRMGRTPLDHTRKETEAYALLKKIVDPPKPATTKPAPIPPHYMPLPSRDVAERAMSLMDGELARVREMGPARLTQLFDELRKNPDMDMRFMDLALMELGEKAKQPALAGLFDPNEAVRSICTKKVLEYRPPYGALQERLLDAIADPKRRLHALYLLGQLGVPEEKTIKTLIKLMGHKDARVRAGAARALGGMGRPRGPTRAERYWTVKAATKLKRLAESDKDAHVLATAALELGRWNSVRTRVRPPDPDVPLGRAFWRQRQRPGTGPEVERALAWLALHQDGGTLGGWDCDGFMKHDPPESQSTGPGLRQFDIGVTGLALLPFLHAGYTDRGDEASNRYAGNVRRGLFFLVAAQDADGCIGPRNHKEFLYGHAIATLALAEACSLTGNPFYREATQRAVDFIEAARNPEMAWRYGMQAGDNDTSITHWMVHALAAARSAGLRVEPKTIQGAAWWINRITDPDFGFVGYLQPGGSGARPNGLKGSKVLPPAPPRVRKAIRIDWRRPAPRPSKKKPEKKPGVQEPPPTMTAAGVLCRRLLGAKRADRMVRKGSRQCLKVLPSWESERTDRDMHYWYVGSMALCRVERDMWKRWREATLAVITASQGKQGPDTGSWDPVGVWGAYGGRVYATAILTDALLVLGYK